MTTQFGPQHSEGKINLGDVSNPEITMQDGTVEKSSVPVQGGGMLAGKKLVIGLIIGFLVIAGLVIGLAVGLTRNKATPVTPVDPSPAPTPVVLDCTSFPADCVGVPTYARTYIFNTYTQVDQARAVLQLSRGFGTLSITSNDAQKVASYQAIFKATECLNHVLSTGYASAYKGLLDVQLTTSSDLSNYVLMNMVASGTPIRLTNPSELATRC